MVSEMGWQERWGGFETSFDECKVLECVCCGPFFTRRFICAYIYSDCRGGRRGALAGRGADFPRDFPRKNSRGNFVESSKFHFWRRVAILRLHQLRISDKFIMRNRICTKHFVIWKFRFWIDAVWKCDVLFFIKSEMNIFILCVWIV